jgi:hypothetical protein
MLTKRGDQEGDGGSQKTMLDALATTAADHPDDNQDDLENLIERILESLAD